MQVSVLQIFKYLLYDWHRFNHNKNMWIKENFSQYDIVKRQVECTNDPLDIGNNRMSEVTFTIFDLETTGFFPKVGDEVISIGAIKINETHIQFPESFYEVITPMKMPSSTVCDLTGLSHSQIKSGNPFPYSFLQFCEFSKRTVLVAHPASFDVNFLKEISRKWGLPNYTPTYVDSYEIATFLYPKKKNSLDELIQFFGIEEKTRHHALNDAFMTAEIFKNLIHELESRNIYTLNEFWKAQKTAKK
ncbi:3'-5' exonuclease [Salipaludibacillus daqingensis]|uniref:3'-5' exonuclease n=1 Tax=Salipaludibacillus daqingensis TaxID=3041001 RepID=UPI002476F885|nr:exonuclease domain-containing protein [Salipaludibacillus daqingensis]